MQKTPHLSSIPLGAQWRASARRALVIETEGMQQLIEALEGPLGDAFAKSVQVIRQARGRVVMTGMGKSGHIARKIAATLASTGTPASFVHPAEASHGDLGMITPDDVIIMISNSGESPELRDILTYSRRFSVPLIAITSGPNSSLGKEADIVLPLPRAREACPNGLAPTTSTLLQLALGDAQAINYFVANNYIKALESLASAPNQKVLMLPLEASSFIGSISGIAEIAKEAFGGQAPPPPRRRGSVPESGPGA